MMTASCENMESSWQNPLPAHALHTIPPVRWETVPCNLCGSGEYDLYHRERLAYLDRPLDFKIVRCKQCSLVYTTPRLADHNPTYLYAGMENPVLIEAHARAKAPIFERALDRIGEFQKRSSQKQPGRLLDLGCGSGHFLHAARQRGFQAVGIEPAAASAQYAIQTFQLDIRHQEILQADLPPNSFHVITAWDVIEHLPDPAAVLRQCWDWLQPGGILALRFPSAAWQKIKAVLFHNLLHSSRAVFGATMHLYFFSEKTFANIARNHGFQILRFYTTGAESNDPRWIVNRLKYAGEKAVRAAEMVTGKHLGNLEVYCQKALL